MSLPSAANFSSQRGPPSGVASQFVTVCAVEHDERVGPPLIARSQPPDIHLAVHDLLAGLPGLFAADVEEIAAGDVLVDDRVHPVVDFAIDLRGNRVHRSAI